MGGKPAKKSPRAGAKPVLLSGGNPQVAKADGDAPVQTFIAAMPGWKHDVGRRLDELIVRTVPGVQKAVRWNTPFYGVAGRGFFLGFHCLTKYVKVAFFRGAALRPPPPVASTQAEVRYLHVHEGEALDEALVANWIKQAAALPGWSPGGGAKPEKTTMTAKKPGGEPSPSELIDERVRELNDWRGETLARVRTLIQKTLPDVVEEWKWRGVPVWSHGGIVCTGETYKSVVKLTFAKGAALPDPAGLFNSSLDGNTRRAIDVREGDALDEAALAALVRAAAALNAAPRGRKR